MVGYVESLPMSNKKPSEDQVRAYLRPVQARHLQRAKTNAQQPSLPKISFGEHDSNDNDGGIRERT